MNLGGTVHTAICPQHWLASPFTPDLPPNSVSLTQPLKKRLPLPPFFYHYYCYLENTEMETEKQKPTHCHSRGDPCW